VLVIDPVENVLQWDSTASQLEDRLSEAIQKSERPVVLLTTGRSDADTLWSRFPKLSRLMPEARFYLAPLDERKLREVIAGSTLHAGLSLNADVIEHLVNDMRRSRAGLTDLALTLRQLWKPGQLALTLLNYRALGGMVGAVERVADAALGQLSDANRSKAWMLLTSLVRCGRGLPDTCRMVTRDWGLGLLGKDEAGKRLLEQLTADGATSALLRLIPSGKDDGGPYLQLVHDALLLYWPALQEHLREDRKLLERWDEVEAAAGRSSPAALVEPLLSIYRGADLSRAQASRLRQLASPTAQQLLEEAEARQKQAAISKQRPEQLEQAQLVVAQQLAAEQQRSTAAEEQARRWEQAHQAKAEEIKSLHTKFAETQGQLEQRLASAEERAQSAEQAAQSQAEELASASKRLRRVEKQLNERTKSSSLGWGLLAASILVNVVGGGLYLIHLNNKPVQASANPAPAPPSPAPSTPAPSLSAVGAASSKPASPPPAPVAPATPRGMVLVPGGGGIQPFWMDQTEVSVKDYKACKGCTQPRDEVLMQGFTGSAPPEILIQQCN
jgi:formylglycine-generating enzyme required for sulfatase activity